MTTIPSPEKYGIYKIDHILSDLYFPFSHFVVTKIEKEVKELFLYQSEMNNDDDESEELRNFEESVSSLIPQNVVDKLENKVYRSIFQDDILDRFSAHCKKMLSREQRVSILTASLNIHIEYETEKPNSVSSFCLQLLTSLWKNEQRLLDQLQMITTCMQFVDDNVLSRTISYVSESKDEEIEQNEGSSDVRSLDSQNSEENEDEFQNALFANWSEALLPNPDSVESKNNGLKSWTANCRIFLLFARKMENSANSVHFLRFCVDFASVIILPSKIPNGIEYLYKLGEIGKRHKETYLDSMETFLEIINLITDIEQNQNIASDALEEFKAQLFGRCIETNIDMTWIKEIIKRAVNALVKKDKNAAVTMIPVIWRILECEKNEINEHLQGSFCNEINSDNLSELDNVLHELNSSGDKERSFHVNIVICDILESLLPSDICKVDFKFGANDTDTFKIARKAVDILSNKSKCTGLTFLIGIAYLRRFFTILSEEVYKNQELLEEKCGVQSQLAEVNSIFKKHVIDRHEQSPLLIFFLKQLLFKMNLLNLQKMCQSSIAIDSMISCFSNVERSKAEFPFYADIEKYREAERGYSELEKHSLAVVQTSSEFINKCKQSKEHVVALMEMFINKFFIKRATRKLNDSEAKMAKWFSVQVTNLPDSETKSAKTLLNALLNERFDDKFLQVSTESSASDVQQAVLLLHIACMTSIIDKKCELSLLLFVCLHNQTDIKLDIRSCVDYLKRKSKHVFHASFEYGQNCICGLRIYIDQPCFVCPKCNKVRGKSTEDVLNSIQDQKDDESKKGKMELTDFQSSILIVFVYANLYAGIALGLTTQEEVEKNLKLENGEGINYCLGQFKSELQSVEKISDLTEPQVVYLIHSIIQGCIGSATESWHKKYLDCASQNLKEISTQPREIKKRMLKNKTAVEHKILELDDDSQHHGGDKTVQRLRHLLRSKKSTIARRISTVF